MRKHQDLGSGSIRKWELGIRDVFCRDFRVDLFAHLRQVNSSGNKGRGLQEWELRNRIWEL